MSKLHITINIDADDKKGMRVQGVRSYGSGGSELSKKWTAEQLKSVNYPLKTLCEDVSNIIRDLIRND